MRNKRAQVLSVGPVVGIVWALLLASCAPGAAPAAVDAPPPDQALVATATPEVAAPPADASAPAVLVTVETDAGPLALIRYQGAEGLCLAVTFDPQAFPVTRCGLAAGAGAGFVDSLPAPDGREVRVAFGQTPGEAVTAVAIEFVGGGNGPAVVASGGYLLVLGSGQTPRRATAIDQYGYMAGQWEF